MSRGIPIITSRQDAGQEINIHGKTGYSADLNNKKKDELFIYMDKISKNNSKLKKMGKNAKNRWKNNFSYKEFKKRFEKIINQFEKNIN